MSNLFSNAKIRDEKIRVEQNINRAKAMVRVDRVETCFAGKKVGSDSALKAAMVAAKQSRERQHW